MKIINLTPHSISVFSAEQFTNLERLDATTWIADGTQGEALAFYPTPEVAARISTSVKEVESDLPGEVVETTYGEATGIPENVSNLDFLIVSLPTKSMAVGSGHPRACQMYSPYKVVRLRGEDGKGTGTVLGCMGFTR